MKHVKFAGPFIMIDKTIRTQPTDIYSFVPVMYLLRYVQGNIDHGNMCIYFSLIVKQSHV